jgi:FG-GAP-like repeat
MQYHNCDSMKLATILSTTLLILGAASASAQTTFTDVTAASGLQHSSETYGASWGELNGDAFPDLFVSDHRTAKSLYVNRGNGTFVDIASQINNFADRPMADTHGASWADYNNNGTQDLLVSIGTGNPSEWYVNSGGKLTFNTTASGLGEENLGGRMPIWLDYNNDHQLDVVVTQYAGIAKLFKNNGNGTFTDTTSAAKLLCQRFHYAQLIDVTGDGKLDFLCQFPAENL